MTTLTPQQTRDTSAFWANKWFVGANALANFSIDDINAAVSAGHGAQTIVQALNSVIPAPFSTATTQQKAELVCFAISKRYGLI